MIDGIENLATINSKHHVDHEFSVPTPDRKNTCRILPWLPLLRPPHAANGRRSVMHRHLSHMIVVLGFIWQCGVWKRHLLSRCADARQQLRERQYRVSVQPRRYRNHSRHAVVDGMSATTSPLGSL